MASPRHILKPPPLRRGDTVGIVAPASTVKREELEVGIARLCELGYQVAVGDSVYDQDLYFAGPAEARARDLMHMFQRDDVRAIICARGGYGSNYLLPLLDLDVIARHPKILVGYSDLTSVLTWIHDETGLATFYGPMAAKDFAHEDGVDVPHWLNVVEGNVNVEITIPGSSNAIVTGEAHGTLYGGCLSILVSSLGTRFEIETGGAILFLEDIGAKPYQIDRMLMQMKYAGMFEGVRAIIFGEMPDCAQPGGQTYTLQEVIARVLGDLNVPVAYGLPFGHVTRNNTTLPLGIGASLAVGDSSVTLKLLESAVSAPARANTHIG